MHDSEVRTGDATREGQQQDPLHGEVGMLHGRFQPFHNGHLECLRWVATHARHIIVGITNPDQRDWQENKLAAHRHTVQANPFSYHDRYSMIAAAASWAGIEQSRLAIVPFFLHNPQVWASYFPAETVHYVSILSSWEKSKADLIERHGYDVRRRRVVRNLSATQVRSLLAQGMDIEHLVPPPVHEALTHRKVHETL